MAVTAAVRALLTYLQQKGLLRMELKLAFGASSRFFWYVLRLPMEFFAQRFVGEIGSEFEINDTVAVLLSGELATNSVNLVMIGFFAALMFHYDASLTLLGIALAAVNLGLMRVLARNRRDRNIKLLQERGKLVGASTAGLQGIEDSSKPPDPKRSFLPPGRAIRPSCCPRSRN